MSDAGGKGDYQAWSTTRGRNEAYRVTLPCKALVLRTFPRSFFAEACSSGWTNSNKERPIKASA